MKQEETNRNSEEDHTDKYANADYLTIKNIKLNYERMEQGIVNELYFLVATVPKMLYSAYPNPDPRPMRIPIPDIRLSDCSTPVVKRQPVKASSNAATFCHVMDSLKNMQDMIITIQGAV